jgi:general secretion pathway protein E
MNAPDKVAFSPELLQRAVRAARTARRRAVDVLRESSDLAPEPFLQRLAAAFGYGAISLRDLIDLQPAFDLVPLAEATRRNAVALRDSSGTLLFVTDDPFDPGLSPWAAERLPGGAQWRIALSEDLVAYLARHEEGMRALDSIAQGSLEARDEAAPAEDLSPRAIRDETNETVRLVRSTLHDALKMGASDVHFESSATGLAIKFRLDGMLSQMKLVSGADQASQVISRIKVLAELDITEQRVPQDGRMRARAGERNVDFRVSIMPSIHGEDAVVRVLDRHALHDRLRNLNLHTLGFDAEEVAVIRKLSSQPYGMLLVTGPTGSGKTTTLYAVLSEINRGVDKIVTIEDPVEYQLQGVLQIPVNERKGLTFAVGLRSILRHDPDRIMVGEIRDPETANIAIQAALTGHLVFTTVHANNVYDVISRFLHMNVDTYSLSSALNGVVAQRLVRLVCPACSRPHDPGEAALAESGLDRKATEGWKFARGAGCGECRGTGYRGRRAVGEILGLDDTLRGLISDRAALQLIKERARLLGVRSLRDSALRAVARGETTLEEANRVTFVV